MVADEKLRIKDKAKGKGQRANPSVSPLLRGEGQR